VGNQDESVPYRLLALRMERRPALDPEVPVSRRPAIERSPRAASPSGRWPHPSPAAPRVPAPHRRANRQRLLLALPFAAALAAALQPAAASTASEAPLASFLAGVQREVLPNGLTLLVREQRGTGVVSIDTWVKAGYFHEPDEKAGMAHLFEHMFFKGSARFPGAERIAQELAAVGGDSNAGTIYDSTNYYFVVPSEGFPRAVEIMADAIANPLFDAAELAKEAEVVIEESNRKLDNPAPLSLERMLATSFTEHRIKRWRIGSNEVLRSIQREDLLAFFQTLYRPENLIVSVAGDLAAADARRIVTAHFGAIPRGQLDKRRGPSEPAQDRFRFGRSTGDLRQGWTVMGWHTQGIGGADEVALDLVAQILGQGRSSRFFRHVIGPGGAATATAQQWQFEDVGTLIVQASFDEANRAEVERRLLAEVERLRAHGPTAAELAVAQRSLESQTALALASSLGQAQALAQAEANGGYQQLGERLARARATNPEMLRDVARRYLTVDRLTLYHYAPAGTPEVSAEQALAAARAAVAEPPPALAESTLPTLPAPLAAARSNRPAEVTRLANGATLIVRERPGAPTVSVGVTFDGGRSREHSGNAGITQLMTAALRRGTTSRSGEAIDRELEALGTNLAADVDADGFGLRLDVVTQNLVPALGLLAEVVTRPTFPESGVAEERNLQLAAVRRSFDSSLQRPLSLAARDLYGSHPYGLPANGTEASLAGLDAAAVTAWWQAEVRAEQAVILVVGDVASEAARQAVSAAFGDLPAGRAAARPTLAAPLPPPARTESIEFRDRRQSAIVMAFAGPPPGDPDSARLALLENITSGLAGTLFAELRGRRSLAYTVFQGFQPRRQGGLVLAYLASETKKEEEAKTALLAELRRLGTDGFGEVELTRGKAALAGSTRIRLETNGALLAELAENHLLGVGLEATEQRLATARATSLAELRATASRWLGAERFATAVLRGKS
jgi:zinc protease